MRSIFVFFLMCSIVLKSYAIEENHISVKFDDKQPITFVGKKGLNGGGGVGGGMMYPADTAGLFLVSILTHAAVSGSVEKSRLSKEQELANQVLIPYEPHIAKVDPDFLLGFDQREVPGSSIVFHKVAEVEDSSRWHLKSVPVFAMTQSQSSLILYNKMTFIDQTLLNEKNNKKKKKKEKRLKKGVQDPNEKLIVIVSDPVLSDEKSDYWLKSDGAAFYDSIKSIYLDSLQLGMANQFGSLAAPQEKQVTIKYLEDGVKKIERGYLIDQTCKRTVFETLANEIKSVPNLDFALCSQG